MAIVQIKFRRDTTTNWSALNPILAAGEPAYDINTGTFKIGDGITRYNSITSIGSGSADARFYAKLNEDNNFTGSVLISENLNIDGFLNVSGSSTFGGNLIGYLNVSGSTVITGSLEITDGIDSIDYITFDTTPEITPAAQGSLVWNDIETTLDIIQNGTVLQVGQELQYKVTNGSGQTIPNGMPVMAIGTSGAAGNIIVGPMDGSSSANSKYFLGVATEEILDGADGKITHFGKVRNIDTRIWNEGDILWVSSSVNGELTNIEPIEPNMAMPTAFVLNEKQNGTIIVRVNNLNTHEFVRLHEDSTMNASLTISGSFSISGSVPTSISGSGTPNEIRVDSNYIYVCVAPNSWKRSALVTWS